mgnify:CR=1 FL=1
MLATRIAKSDYAKEQNPITRSLNALALLASGDPAVFVVSSANPGTPAAFGGNLAEQAQNLATQNAANTAAIMNSNTDIKNLSNQILQAVTGQRTGDAGAGGLLSAGLGGGNSIAAVAKAGVGDRIGHISTGGGASLEFIAKGTLPGLDALEG